MTGHTVLFGHMSRVHKKWKTGEIIHPGNIVGFVGNTGVSSGPHLHIGIAEGKQWEVFTVADFEAGRVRFGWEALQQLYHFIDDGLMPKGIRVTSQFLDTDYFTRFGWRHFGLDIVSADGAPNAIISWNRTIDGMVLKIGYHPGYGNYLIAYLRVA